MTRTLKKNITVQLRDKDGNITGGQTFGPDYPGELPADLVKEFSDLDIWEGAPKTQDPKSGLRDRYSAMKVDELKAIIDKMDPKPDVSGLKKDELIRLLVQARPGIGTAFTFRPGLP